MATQFPSNTATWGVTNQTGVLTESTNHRYQADQKEIRGATGNVEVVSMFNERIEADISGYLPVSSPFSTSIAATLTLAMTPIDYLAQFTPTNSAIVTSIEVTNSNEDFRKITINAIHWPDL